MAQRTRLGLYGGPRQVYGPFGPKTEIADQPVAVGQTTRLGLYGGPRQVYGAFGPKTEGEAVAARGQVVMNSNMPGGVMVR